MLLHVVEVELEIPGGPCRVLPLAAEGDGAREGPEPVVIGPNSLLNDEGDVGFTVLFGATTVYG